MIRRLALVAAALAAAGCGNDQVASTPIRLEQPSAVAVFRGVADKNPGAVHPYVAVANAARNDLTLVDAVDGRPVLAPVLVRTLAIPTPDARPALLAASSLWDGDDVDVTPAPDPLPAPTPDLLVMASEAVPVLRLVKTWGPVPDVRVLDEPGDDRSVDLGALAPDAQILALATAPVPDGQLPPRKTAGRVRVLAALTGARLGVVEYARSAADDEIVVADAWVQPLEAGGQPFGALSLAVNPADPAHLYVASPDPIGGVLGVAELDMTGARGAWSVRALDARAPTRLVAAARVRERKKDGTGEPDNSVNGGAFEPTPVDRVYAVLDETVCGVLGPIACGLAVIDPVAGGLRADYAELMPYLAPIFIPGTPTAIAISLAPERAPAATPYYVQPPLMKISPGTGTRGTSAVAALPAADGRVYFVDLGRWAVPTDQSILFTTSRTRVVTATSFRQVTSVRALGLWKPGNTPAVTVEPADLAPLVRVTPGFTTSETWQVQFQPILPGLLGRPAEAAVHGDGRTRVALQVRTPAAGGGEVLTQVTRVFDPVLGVRPGDIVQLFAPDVEGCSDTRAAEAFIAELLPPAAGWPGGALVLDPSIQDPVQDDESTPENEHDDWPGCVAAVGAASARNFVVSVRTRDLVLLGTATGYGGRVEISYDAPPANESAPLVGLAYEDEDALACPLDPWPADPTSVACDESCRRGCERLALARKARRFYHVSDTCASTNAQLQAQCLSDWKPYLEDDANRFPYANGPVIAFPLGYAPDPDDPDGRLPADDQTLWPDLRALSLTLQTQTGITPTYRASLATSGAAPTYPTGIATFDRSAYPGKEVDGYRFYVSFLNDYVLDFTPSLPINTPVVLR